ncbi:hypothetical protein CSUI_001963 [Cystoisospora suis]|uniref:Enoyl reductase (ER) domain-containing protein n=1 Tax=Cystoisospora suis TaxID=483139 RepID=A0A2C6KVM8_9APIC|nr:hypothetical protein CSUI_001963 [Cystoisospora suis]
MDHGTGAESTHRGALFGQVDRDAVSTDLFRRLGETESCGSHSSGFEKWLRSRPPSSFTVVNDEVILNSRGAVRTREDEVYRHQCTWPVTTIVRRGPVGSGHSGQVTRSTECSGNDAAFQQPVRTSTEEDEATWERVQVSTERLKLKPELEWGEVLVRILHAPVVPYDLVMLREGFDVLGVSARTHDDRSDYSPLKRDIVDGEKPEDEAILGSTCLAEVVEVGRGVKSLKIGDYVMPLTAGHGCWRAAATWAERDLIALPKDLFPRTEETAVCRSLFLAYHLLQEHARELQPGDGVLVNDAGCLVGQLIVQFCRLLGLRCICVLRDNVSRASSIAGYMRLPARTKSAIADIRGVLKTRNPFDPFHGRPGREEDKIRERDWQNSFQSQADYMLSLGATHVFTPGDDVAEKLAKEKQRLPMIAFDFSAGSLGGLTVAKWLARDGKAVLVPAAAEVPLAHEKATVPWNEILSRNLHFESFFLDTWLQSAKNQKKMRVALESIGGLVRAGKVVIDLADPFNVTSQTSTEDILDTIMSLEENRNGFRQPIFSFASLETDKLLWEEERRTESFRREQARQARDTLFSDVCRNLAKEQTRENAASSSALPPSVKTGADGLSFLEMPPEETFSAGVPEIPRCLETPLCVFAHGRGEIPEELLILLRHYKQSFHETFKNAHFIFPRGPFTCAVDGDELPCWTTPKFSTLFVRPDMAFKGWQCSQGGNRRSGGQVADLTAEDIEALKDLEISCDLLADLVEEQVTMKEGETSQSSGTGASRGVVLAGVGEGAVVTLLTALTKLRFPVEAVMCVGAPLIEDRILHFLLGRALNTSKQVGGSTAASRKSVVVSEAY